MSDERVTLHEVLAKLHASQALASLVHALVTAAGDKEAWAHTMVVHSDALITALGDYVEARLNLVKQAESDAHHNRHYGGTEDRCERSGVFPDVCGPGCGERCNLGVHHKADSGVVTEGAYCSCPVMPVRHEYDPQYCQAPAAPVMLKRHTLNHPGSDRWTGGDRKDDA